MPLPKLAPIGPWPLGVDNVHDAYHTVFQGSDKEPQRLLVATNVDLTDDGNPILRPPLAEIEPVASGIGYWSLKGHAYLQNGDSLYEDGAVVASGFSDRITLCEHAGLVFCAEGDVHYELDDITGETVVRAWGLPVPTISLSEGTGSLDAERTFLVQAAFVDVRGNEGGTSLIYPHTMTAKGGLVVSASGQSDYCTHVNIYASRLTGRNDQDTTSFVAQVALGSLPYTLATDVTVADPPRTEGMIGPIDDAAGMFSFRAFLMMWRDNVVFRSEAQEPHLFHPDNIMQFPANIRAAEGTASGMWVGTEQGLWWVAGEDPSNWIPTQKTFTAVARGSFKIEGDKLPTLETREVVALFLTADGLVAGLPGGNAVHLTKNRYIFDTSQRASFAYVERDHFRQLLIALVD